MTTVTHNKVQRKFPSSVTPHLSNPQTRRENVCPVATKEPQVVLFPHQAYAQYHYTQNIKRRMRGETPLSPVCSDNEIWKKLVWKKGSNGSPSQGTSENTMCVLVYMVTNKVIRCRLEELEEKDRLQHTERRLNFRRTYF